LRSFPAGVDEYSDQANDCKKNCNTPEEAEPQVKEWLLDNRRMLDIGLDFGDFLAEQGIAQRRQGADQIAGTDPAEELEMSFHRHVHPGRLPRL